MTTRKQNESLFTAVFDEQGECSFTMNPNQIKGLLYCVNEILRPTVTHTLQEERMLRQAIHRNTLTAYFIFRQIKQKLPKKHRYLADMGLIERDLEPSLLTFFDHAEDYFFERLKERNLR